MKAKLTDAQKLCRAVDASGFGWEFFVATMPRKHLRAVGLKRKRITAELIHQAQSLDRQQTAELRFRVQRTGGSWNGEKSPEMPQERTGAPNTIGKPSERSKRDQDAPREQNGVSKESRRVILASLREWGPQTVQGLFFETDIPKGEIEKCLQKLATAGKVKQRPNGEWKRIPKRLRS